MTLVECPRDADVAEAVACGQWPEYCAAELRDHVLTCPACAELVAVMVPLRQARTAAWQEAAVPDAHVVWWRAQIRARAEAAQTVAQPMTFVQAAAAVALAVVVLAFAPGGLRWLGVRLPDAALVQALSEAVSRGAGPAAIGAFPAAAVLAGAAACVALAAVALYVVLAEE